MNLPVNIDVKLFLQQATEAHIICSKRNKRSEQEYLKYKVFVSRSQLQLSIGNQTTNMKVEKNLLNNEVVKKHNISRSLSVSPPS